MPGIDASIPLGVQSPLTNISSLLNIRSQQQQQELQQQQIQAGGMQNQQSAIDLQETQNAMGIMKRIKDYQDPQGNVDFNRLAPDMAQAAPKNWSKFMTGVMQAQQAHTQAVQSVNTLDADTRQQVGKVLYSLKGSKPQVVADTIGNFEKTYPNLTPALELFRARAQSVGDNQPALDDLLDQAGRMVEAPPSQQTMQTPSGVTNDDGQNYGVTSVKPGATVPPGQTIPGTAGTHQLPPTTPVMGSDASGTPTPGYLGSRPTAQPPGAPHQGRPGTPEAGAQGYSQSSLNILLDERKKPSNTPDDNAALDREIATMRKRLGQPAQPGSGFVASGAPMGTEDSIRGRVATNNQHYQTVQTDAQNAPNIVSSLQTIKEQIPKASMGSGSAGDLLRKWYKLYNGDAATAQDVMAKNLAVLVGQSGNTDAARSIAEMGTPSYHMTPEAAQKATDQLIGIALKKQAAGSYFAGVPTNSSDYTNRINMWNKYADPRAFEYAHKSPAEQAAMKAEMKKAGTWDTLADNMRHMHAMGVEPQ